MKRAIEAILFINGDPVSFRTLAGRLARAPEDVEAACAALQEELRARNAGLALVTNGGSVQLVTAGDLAPVVESFVKHDTDENLTPAALETLSVISYLGPVSRPEVEYIRGVNSAFIIRNLLMRGLVEKEGDRLYRASAALLHYLGIQRIKDLPVYEEHHRLLEEYRSQKQTP
ncbi:MAG: SMC-Scp complex subunit ScpB [Candidatus Liptonbacteria bacterium]|nr:SMC-Scp complex subunit ScpB [Candidatus Liptonbacteria bacterium]